MRSARSSRLSVLGIAGLMSMGLPPTAGGQRPNSLPRVTLRPGLILTRSARIVPGNYRLPAPVSLDSALLIVRGNNLSLDFTGVTLEGQSPDADPDQAAGVAIRIEGGRNVRIQNARIRGYKVGILARGTRGLSLRHVDASHNWKPRLYSVIEQESLLDWLSFHHNEQREWLRYGAAFYLEEVRTGELVANRAVQGMNGFLLVKTDSLRIEDNELAFNSGLGIGLYRSSDNTIVRNRLDYNVRGYSHGFYRRGQDSADLLLYEQSSRNLVAWNSATHGGDGLFLWAGQSTMDTGQGGANDNLFFGNDFSFAPANAMEATFSRNRFVGNRAAGSDYGLWGGYSFGSLVQGNCFAGNRTGVAIEHGQDNLIAGNIFSGDSTAISLWANPIEPSDWGYPKHRDTRSRDYRITGNSFAGSRVALRIRNTGQVAVTGNRFERVDTLAALQDTVAFRLDSASASGPAQETCGTRIVASEEASRLLARLGPPARAPTSALARADRSAIVVDEWGPYDWRSPKLWPVDSSRAMPLRLRTLGPPGHWSVVSQRGIAALSRTAGRIGDTLSVTPSGGGAGDWEVELEYVGGATQSPRGAPRAAGRPYRFGFHRFEPRLTWSARFFGWNDSTDVLRDSSAFDNLLRKAPILARQLPRLDFEWYRPAIAELPRERWALEASTTVDLPPGAYLLRTISDDGIRIWVDGRLAIDRWTQHESALDTVTLSGGRHELKVRYFQLDGWTELRVEIVQR